MEQSWRISVLVAGMLFSKFCSINARISASDSGWTANSLYRCFGSSNPFWSTAQIVYCAQLNALSSEWWLIWILRPVSEWSILDAVNMVIATIVHLHAGNRHDRHWNNYWGAIVRTTQVGVLARQPQGKPESWMKANGRQGWKKLKHL